MSSSPLITKKKMSSLVEDRPLSGLHIPTELQMDPAEQRRERRKTMTENYLMQLSGLFELLFVMETNSIQ